MDGFVVDLDEILDPSHVLQEEGEKEVDVTVVSLDGILCKSFLGDQVVEKKFLCLEKFLGKGLAVDGNILLARKRKTPDATIECNGRSNFLLLTASCRISHV